MQWDRPLTGNRSSTFPPAAVGGRELHPSLTKFLSRRWQAVTPRASHQLPSRSASCPPQNWMFSSKVPRPLPLSDSRTRTGTNAPQPDIGPTPTHFGQWNCYGPEPAQAGPRGPSWEAYAPGRSFNKVVEQNRIGATPRMGKPRSSWNFKAQARLEEGEWERVQCRPQALSCNSPFDGEHSHVQHKRMIARLQPLIAKCSDTGATHTSSMAQIVPVSFED